MQSAEFDLPALHPLGKLRLKKQKRRAEARLLRA
jgi:hypothetical protein